MGNVTPYGYAPTTSVVDSGAMLGAIAGTVGVFFVISLAVLILMIVAQWKIFTKAGEKGWKCLIPIYNMVVLFKIIGLSPWLLLLYLLSAIPVVGGLIAVVLSIVSMVKLGQAFNKSAGFIIGLILLGPIFELILAFGSSQYVGTEKTNSTDANV